MALIEYSNNLYDTVKVTFAKELNESERDRAVKIARYWGNIYYTGDFKDAWVSDGNTLVVRSNEKDCSRRRNSLENLGHFLEVGTMIKRKDGQRTYEGLGQIVNSIKGLS